MKTEAEKKGLGTKMAEDLNSIIDNAPHWTARQIQDHAMAIQPDRKLQALWDAAPDLLEAAKDIAAKFPYAGNITVQDADRLTAAIAKAESA